MRRFLLFIIISLNTMVFLSQEKPMNSAEIKAFKEQVVAVSGATTTMTSDFVQYKHLDFLNNDIITQGELFYKSPNLVKWEYTQPYQYAVIFKETQMLINDGGKKSSIDISNSKQFKNLNSLIVHSVQGTLFEEQDFESLFFKTEKGNKVIVVLKDEKMKKYITSFELLFNKKDAMVTELKMIEPSGDYTKIIFTNKAVNSPLLDAIFNF